MTLTPAVRAAGSRRFAKSRWRGLARFGTDQFSGRSMRPPAETIRLSHSKVRPVRAMLAVLVMGPLMTENSQTQVRTTVNLDAMPVIFL